jgi:hypothetical protein
LSLFLLGAGFNIDANREAGPVHNSYYGNKIDCGYPLVAEMLQLCFGLDKQPAESIEQLFADAKKKHDIGPMERLVDRLMEADHYLARKLATSDTPNVYRRFFEKFSDSHFLTFNYDSLPEIYLHRKERWYPGRRLRRPRHNRIEVWSEPASEPSFDFLGFASPR